jgi:alkyl hydroperoxide reductase subunit AhpC
MMAVRYPKLQELGVEVIGVSVDSVNAHKLWDEVELKELIGAAVPFPLGADRGGKLGSMFGTYDQQQGVNQRAHFLIDPQGVVQLVEVLPSSVGRNVDELIRIIQACQEQQSSGASIPAGWQPGDSALSGDLQTAGRIWQEWKPERAAQQHARSGLV